MIRTLIFHVIGTLTMKHVRNSLESLDRQRPFHWERFVLYNGSPLDTDEIMSMAPLELFDTHSVFPYDPNTPKGAIADWTVQMGEIGGSDRYLTQKADFYLADNVIKNLDAMPDSDFFVLFKKVDMKERSGIGDIRRLSKVSWGDIKADPEIGRFPNAGTGVSIMDHVGKLGVLWDGYPLDGTMHAYSDSFRPFWKPTEQEKNARHIWMGSMLSMFTEFPYLILDDDFFALHQFHYVPEKADPIKKIPGERF